MDRNDSIQLIVLRLVRVGNYNFSRTILGKGTFCKVINKNMLKSPQQNETDEDDNFPEAKMLRQ